MRKINVSSSFLSVSIHLQRESMLSFKKLNFEETRESINTSYVQLACSIEPPIVTHFTCLLGIAFPLNFFSHKQSKTCHGLGVKR